MFVEGLIRGRLKTIKTQNIKLQSNIPCIYIFIYLVKDRFETHKYISMCISYYNKKLTSYTQKEITNYFNFFYTIKKINKPFKSSVYC